MRKIIFLDIDGVMNSLNERRLHPEDFGKMYDIDPKPVAILNNLIEKTGAEIVLSSAWRYDPNYFQIMKDHDIHVIGRTGSHKSRFRGEEIDIWLDEHDYEEIRYAIIDDDSDFYPHQPHFKTSGYDWGLTQEIADRVFFHLGNK